MRRTIGFLSSIVALSTLAGTAHADGAIPRVLSIEFNPSDPEHIVVAGAGVGLFSTRDGGTSWEVNCYDSLGQRGNGVQLESVPLLVTAQRGVFASRVDWATLYAPGGTCRFSEPAFGGTDGLRGIGVKRAADGSLFALGSLGMSSPDGGSSGTTELFHSDASGTAFSPSGVPLVGSFFGDSFALAPSSPDLVYVGGVVLNGDGTSGHAIARTGDLGATWQITPWSLPSDDASDRREILAVDPTRSNLLFARESQGGSSLTRRHVIWFSRDSGATWRLLHRAAREVVGFAYSPDGKTIALGDAGEGLFHVDIASLLGTGTPVITRVFPHPVWAIAWNERGLYAGLDEFRPKDEQQFVTLGVSHDDGRSFEPFLSVCSVNQSSCEGPAASACYADFVRDYQVSSGRCGNSNGVGGGTGGNGSSSAGGGSGGAPAADAGGAQTDAPEDLRVVSCAMAGPRAPAGRIVSLALAAASVLMLLRRTRRSP